MPKPLPPQTLAWLRQSAAVDGAVTAQVLLHLLERVEALEQKYETQRVATLEWGEDVDKLMRWIDIHLKRIMALEAEQQQPHQDKLDRLIAHDADDPAPEAAPVVADDELCRVYSDELEHHGFGPAIRAVYNLGRKHGAAAAQPAPLADCPACEGMPSAFNNPCCVCGLSKSYQPPAAQPAQPPAAQPAPPAAAAGGLVEMVGEVMERHRVVRWRAVPEG